MTFTTDQPMHAATLKKAMMMPPTQPKEKREIVIWRNPNLGPSVEKKATGRVPRALKMMMMATLPQIPRTKMGMAKAPRPTVEITRLAESHMVKLSKMLLWAGVVDETRSIPCISTPFSSSGMVTVSEAMNAVLLEIVGVKKPGKLFTRIIKCCFVVGFQKR